MIHGLGQYATTIITVPLPRGEVRKMLEPGLELAPLPPEIEAIVPDDTHPVLFTLGSQRNVHPSRFAVFNLDYLEASADIPLVRPTKSGDSTQTYFYTSRIYLTKFFPLLLGLVYGLPKQRADMGMGDECYAVNNHSDCELVLECAMETDGPPGKPSDYPLFEKAMPRLLGDPVISKVLGMLIWFKFVWKFDQATVQPMKSTLNLVRPVREGAPTGRFQSPSLQTSPLGSFRIFTPWEMFMPHRYKG